MNACMFLSLSSFKEKHNIPTKNYKSDQEFNQNSTMLFTLMNQNSEGLFIKDLEGRYILVNSAGAKILGLPIKEIIGTKDQDLMSLEDYETVHADDLAVLSSGKIRIKEEVLNLRGENRTYICTKGVYKDDKGEIAGIMCLCRDVSEKIRMKTSLQETEKQFKSLFDNVPLGIYRTTPDGKILMANPAMLKMLKYSSFEEFSKRNLEKGFYEPAYSRKEFKEILERDGEIKGLETKCIRKDGSVIFIRENARIVRNNKGQIICYEGSIEDITERKIAEDAMYRLGAIVQSSQDSIVTTDFYDIISNWNLGAEKLYGIKTKDAIGKSIYILVPEDKKEEMRDNLQRIKQGGHINNFETVRLKSSGERIYVSVSINPIKDVYGRIIGVASIARNITDRKKLEKQLSNMASIVQTSQDCIIAVNKKGLITNWNHGAEKLYGYTAKEAIGQSIYMIAPPGRKREIKIIVKRILNGEYVASLETVRMRKNGELVNILVDANPIKDDNGNILGFASIAKDITQRKVLEEELRFQKNLLELQSEASIEGIVVVSASDRIVSFNSQFLQMWNIEKNLVNNVKHRDLLNILQKNVLNQKDFITKVINLRKLYETESTDEIFLKNGKIYERYTTPIKDNKGNFYGRVWYFHDITESKLYEKQREMLIAVAGHELKTPITSIKAFTQLLQKRLSDQDDKISRDYLERMDDQLDRLTRLTQDLLDVIKIRGGKLEYEKEVIDIQNLVKKCVDDLQKTTFKHKITFTGNDTNKVFIDPHRINQVINNLLGNAIKYSPNSEKIFVKINSHDNFVIISVQDFGLGIPDGYKDKVFQSFMRLTTTKDEVFPGLGMGLYIASEIVKAHGGKIWVESKKGRGSIFTIALPIYRKKVLVRKVKKVIKKQSVLLSDSTVVNVG